MLERYVSDKFGSANPMPAFRTDVDPRNGCVNSPSHPNVADGYLRVGSATFLSPPDTRIQRISGSRGSGKLSHNPYL